MQEERKRILKMVEDGKLTVNEALQLLEELDKSSQTMEQKQQEIVNELSTIVKDEEKKEKSSYGHYKSQSVKDMIFDFVDSAFKKIKDFDLDFNFGKSVEISHIFQQSDVFLTGIDIDVANGSVTVVPWDQNDVRIECQSKVYRVETVDEARRKFLSDALFAIEGQKMRFSSQQKWMKVDAKIFVPASQYESVRVRLFNGSIKGENLNINDFKAKTANGKIDLESIRSKKVEVETANGKIQLKKSNVHELEAETINGAIKLEGTYGNAELKTFNGNIECKLKGSDCHLLEAEATTGSIEVYVPYEAVVEGELKSNLGGFNVELEGIQTFEEKNEVVQKKVRFKPTSDQPTTMKVFADTKTGAVAVKRALS